MKKGEYNLEEKDRTHHMFPNMRQTHNFQQPLPPPPLHPHHHNLHHFHLTQNQQPQTSEDSDSQTPTAPTATAAHKEPNSDGATIEVARRPRGRPPGSKNKPKPPIIITREPEPSMTPYVLEVSGGVDLIEATNRFCRKRNTGICILSASGTVANVTLRQSAINPGGSAVTFHGRFDLLSLSATVFPATMSFLRPAAGNEFSITLAGPQGQIVGGMVVGPLFAAGTVYVIAASFNNPSFHRLPVEEEGRSSGSGGNEGRSSSPVVQGGGDDGHAPPPAAESCGMSFYSGGHLGSDVIWAPTARQPPPPPPHY